MGVGDEVDDGDALVVATSGSTGAPKGVVLTHDAIAASAEATSRRLEVTTDDHWLACLPLSHVGGLSVVTRALHTGTRLTVLPGFDADAVAAVGATLVSLVATALRRIDPSIFRTIVLGGSRPPADRPPNTVTTYGMTETGSGVVYDGVPLDGVEVRLDDDAEVWLRGPMLMRCYRDGSSPFDADGWLPTGDLGRWLDDGRLHVDGRRGDLIITGGENVWPEAVEAILAVASGGGRGDGARRRRRRVGPSGRGRRRAGGRRSSDARLAPRRTSRSRTRRSWRPGRSGSSTRSPAPPSANSAAPTTFECVNIVAHTGAQQVHEIGSVAQALGATPAPPSIT